MSEAALKPGAVIGILGGGQLGRMLSMAAARLGMRCHIYDPDPKAPAAQVAESFTCAAWDDLAALAEFATHVEVVTFEFENIPTAALDRLESLRPVRPGRRALGVSQDRLSEKQFLNGLGLATAPFAPVESVGELQDALERIGTPAILKTRRLGYDGKGQVRLEHAAGAGAAFEALAGAPAILEGFVPFDREVSVIVSRGLDGAVACFDPGENRHEAGILRRTEVPATLTVGQRTDAVLLAGQIANALDYVGVMGVELFVVGTRLLVNEIAPRVHNSGHWTQSGCAVDQFEQHIRAVAGWPLGDGGRFADVVMENLVGDEIARVPALARESGVSIHLYGKSEARPGRKMGHINRVRPLGG